MQNTYLNGIDIRVEPFDLTLSGSTYKLDLLYYNNVNRYGEILSSLAYNSGVRTISNQDVIIYTPNKLFLNTDIERNYSLTGTSTRWKNADLLTTGTSNLKDNSADAIYTYDHFDETTDYAITYKNGEHSYDGWYTLVSIALQEYTDGAIVSIGTLRYDTVTEEVQYNTGAGTWSDLNTIDTTIDIYNFIREDRSEIYSTFDFMVTVKSNSLYKTLLDNKLEGDWYKKINILNPKLRTLNSAIEFEKYSTAQHIINAINDSLLALLI